MMKDSKSWLMGFYVGIALALVIFLVLFLIRNKNGNKPKFDERQITARNHAYKYAFFTLLVYITVCGFLDTVGVRWAQLTAMLFIGTMASVTVFAAICIFKDAYEAINERRHISLILWVCIGGVNTGTFIMNLVKGVPFFTDGLLNEQVIYPCMGSLFLVLGAVQLIKNLTDKKAAEKE